MHCIQNNSDYYSGEYEISIRYWTDYLSVFSSLKSSVNSPNTKDKNFAPMDNDCRFWTKRALFFWENIVINH